MARHLIDHGAVSTIQIDTGRIGGIGPAKAVADYAAARGVTYVNHTFTSHLALSASLQPFAGLAGDTICEYPIEPKALAAELTLGRIERNVDGQICLPEAPGLGIEPDLEAIAKYLVPLEISVRGQVLYSTPRL
jgi:L-alanine-DL-glutamate epimerase-like enolase superfamily enzyme